MTQSKYLNFRGKKIEIKELENGDYIDAEGTVYPAVLFDPGYCGITPLTTNNQDPFWKRACQPHDLAFDQMKLGYDAATKGNFGTFLSFAKEVGIVMAMGLFQVGAGIPYILVGGLGGMARWWWLDRE